MIKNITGSLKFFYIKLICLNMQQYKDEKSFIKIITFEFGIALVGYLSTILALKFTASII
jgi:hypothetical protein